MVALGLPFNMSANSDLLEKVAKVLNPKISPFEGGTIFNKNTNKYKKLKYENTNTYTKTKMQIYLKLDINVNTRGAVVLQ